MKKSILIVLVLLLLLTGCQTVLDSEIEPAGSTPPSSSITPPSSSVPATSTPATSTPATSTPATSTPVTNPPEPDETGYSFVYDGTAPFIGIDADCSGCTVGHLYWVDKTTEEVTPILEEPALESIQEGTYVYYVKTAEPTKIYRTPIGKFSQHEMIYESTHGKVSAMIIDTFTIQNELVLQFVADEKKFVVLELETGEATLVMEQYYIKSAMFDHLSVDTWKEATDFVFWGKLDDNDSIQSYRYIIETGEIREEGECAD